VFWCSEFPLLIYLLFNVCTGTVWRFAIFVPSVRIQIRFETFCRIRKVSLLKCLNLFQICGLFSALWLDPGFFYRGRIRIRPKWTGSSSTTFNLFLIVYRKKKERKQKMIRALRLTHNYIRYTEHLLLLYLFGSGRLQLHFSQFIPLLTNSRF
jgi:hypothetical protein